MARFGTQDCDFLHFSTFFVNCVVTEHTLNSFHVLIRSTFDAEFISSDAGAIYCELVNLEREVTVTFEI